MSGLPVLDWASRHDPRSRDYPVRELVRPAKVLPARWWTPGPVLDQGEEGACVGFGCAGKAAASPIRLPHVDDAVAREWYELAKRLDGVPGEDYSGTSVLAGMKAGVERGAWKSYRWAFGISDVLLALTQVGPVVIGVDWTQSMYETKPSGEVVVDGPVVGGHCLLLTGYSPRYGSLGPTVRWRNSWGPSYGRGGNGYISVPKLEALLAGNGEAAVALRH